jgi:hypothetical protein
MKKEKRLKSKGFDSSFILHLIVHIVRDAAIRNFFLKKTIVLNSCKSKSRIDSIRAFRGTDEICVRGESGAIRTP